jgi:uncharacterized protein YgfB (UPF0149 family)
MTQAVQYTDLADALARLGFSQDAAEYHGALCGALCVQASEEVELDRVVPSEDGHAPFGDAPAHQALERVRDESIQALESSDAIFMPLLPEDSAKLEERARALASWCEGFLYGLASRGNLDLGAASPEVREMVSDLVQFSHATSSDDGDEEIEENAYAELVEYIRVGAQLIFMELRPPEAATDPDRQILH